MPSPSAWARRRVLVTGHTGFKGAWLSLWLSALGAEVSGLSARAPVSHPSLFDVAGVRALLSLDERGDIRDPDCVADVMARTRPEVVFHLAAQAIVRTGLQAPVETFDVNVRGTATLLDACRDVPAVVVVTSDKCYAHRDGARAFREGDALGGRDPYSASKAAQEHVVAAFRETVLSDRVGIATARAGNVIGGGDWAPDRLVPDAMRAALAGTPLVVRNPAAIRPWQHVLCPLHGYLMLAERLLAGSAPPAVNFGPADDDALPVGAIAARLAALWPGGIAIEQADAGNPEEAPVLRLDASLARAALDWTPRWDLDDALRATVDWFAGYARGDDPLALCEQQIAAYGGIIA